MTIWSLLTKSSTSPMKKHPGYQIVLFLIMCCTLIAQTSQSQHIGQLRDKGFSLRFADTARCIALQQQALSLARKEGNNEELVISYVKLAQTYQSLFNNKKLGLYTDSAYSLANSQKTPQSIAYANLAMGTLKSFIGDNAEATSYLLNAYTYFNQVEDHRICEKIAIELTKQFNFNDLEKQQKYASIAITEAARINDPEYTLQARGTYANYLVARRNNLHNISVDTIISYIRHTADIANKSTDSIITKANLALIYLNLGVLYFDSLTAPKEPLFWENIDKSIRLAVLYNVPTVHARAIGVKGDYLLAKGDLSGAEQLFKEGIAYQRKQPFTDNRIMAMFYEALKEVAFKQQDLMKYHQYDSLFAAYNQLQFNDTKIQALENADVRFETANKVARITALEKENELQRNNKWMGYGISGLLAAGLIFMLRGYHFRKKYYLQSENVLKAQQKTTALQLQLQQQQTMEALTQKLSVESRLLQSQMDPHFVFNALGNIQSFILQHETQNAVTYLSRFSKLMRQILTHSKKESIALQDEIEMLKNYIEIQKLRLNHSFDYTINKDATLDLQISIPPMMLQPFIENAVEHGLKPLNNTIKGALNIYFMENRQQHCVVCTITDNGVGIQHAHTTKQNNTSHESMAIAITRERLQYLTGQGSAATITINELTDRYGLTAGTEVVVKIPVNH